jgi:hypothetical protein
LLFHIRHLFLKKTFVLNKIGIRYKNFIFYFRNLMRNVDYF